MVWLDPTGRFIGAINSAMNQGTRLVAVDEDEQVTLCGVASTEVGENTALCEAYYPDDQEPIWFFILGTDIDGVVGAAMAPNLLVVTGNNWFRWAIQQPPASATRPIMHHRLRRPELGWLFPLISAAIGNKSYTQLYTTLIRHSATYLCYNLPERKDYYL
jgi:hypothetical protein